MSSHTARWPTQPPDNGDNVPMIELYKLAIDEYRFQAQFNWSRTQYWLVFNSGILAAGVALLAAFNKSAFAIIVFAVGIAACGLSARAIQVTHGYYRAARNRVRLLENELHLDPELRLNTTAKLRGQNTIQVNATAVTYLLLAAVAAADVAGIITTVAR